MFIWFRKSAQLFDHYSDIFVVLVFTVFLIVISILLYVKKKFAVLFSGVLFSWNWRFLVTRAGKWKIFKTDDNIKLFHSKYLKTDSLRCFS